MRLITVWRAVAWVGVLVAGWALVGLRWGADVNLNQGPPGQWERHVTGIALLTLIAAISLSVSGREGKPPSWLARGVAAAAALGAFLIPWVLRSNAYSEGKEHMLAGPGWTWAIAGAGLVVAAVIGTAALKAPEPTKPTTKVKTKAKPNKRRR